MITRSLWSRILVIAGGIAMLLGAIDPLEGSLFILPGSGLFALGTFLGPSERRVVLYRLWAFLLIAIGVGALWGLSRVGGIGGESGRSMWWGVLILPYMIGWSMSIWGPGSPRWLSILGSFAGLWYLVLPVIVLMQSRSGPPRPAVPEVLIVFGIIGVLTIVGCVRRLRRRTAEE